MRHVVAGKQTFKLNQKSVRLFVLKVFERSKVVLYLPSLVSPENNAYISYLQFYKEGTHKHIYHTGKQ